MIAAELRTRIEAFNERVVGALNTREIVLTVRDDAGNLIAGLTGEMFWNVLHVDVLWVDENHRDKNHGTELLKHAEHLAADQSCEAVYLSTFGFQAPGFYSKQGYNVIGDLPDVPKHSMRRWFWKRLPSPAV
ncbi:GCN5-related N-acetyltransferase [Pedosphaera parvula Ellin514]|uniref:GCN5-related N-acetyltransferase n=2 Tax=Pedosphaera TaxID=1032526 RepID=B9XQU9_PEDPL|nr:GCN5-related N-acetyltransferase [Pedosphaera parvula Ellin514]